MEIPIDLLYCPSYEEFRDMIGIIVVKILSIRSSQKLSKSMVQKLSVN